MRAALRESAIVKTVPFQKRMLTEEGLAPRHAGNSPQHERPSRPFSAIRQSPWGVWLAAKMRIIEWCHYAIAMSLPRKLSVEKNKSSVSHAARQIAQEKHENAEA